MTEMILDALQDALTDTAKLIPFLFATYIVMEILERKASNASVDLLQKFGRFSPAVGAAVGHIRRNAADLYIGEGTGGVGFKDPSDKGGHRRGVWHGG